MSARRVVWAIAAAAIALAALAYAAAPQARSAAFLADLAGLDVWWRPLLPSRSHAVSTRDLVIPTRHGPISSRLYEPDATPLGSLLVYPGIHAGGVDEPRLVRFAKRLAGTGIRVLTVPLPDLRVYRITPASTDAIEDTAVWMTNDAQLSPGRRAGLVGVSFAGGLALAAAGRPSLRDRVTLVVSLGGHADLPRVMRYLCTGQLPDGTSLPAHDYAVAVVLLAALPKLVPADQVTALEQAILTFLDASSYAGIDAPRAAELLADARRQLDALPEPAQGLMREVIVRDAGAVGRRMLPFVEDVAGLPGLSPVRSEATMAPVFLLHGLNDNIIPTSESSFAADYLRSGGNTRVKLLLTPLIAHADLAETMPIGESWRLIRFWTEMLNTAGRSTDCCR